MDTITFTTDILAEWNLKLLCEELAAKLGHPFVRGYSDGSLVGLGRHDEGDWLRSDIDIVQAHLPLHDATAKTQDQQDRLDAEQARLERRARLDEKYATTSQLNKDLIDEVLGR